MEIRVQKVEVYTTEEEVERLESRIYAYVAQAGLKHYWVNRIPAKSEEPSRLYTIQVVTMH